MFSDGSATALLGTNEVQSLTEAVIGAQSQLGPDGKGSHGYYGLDWAQNNGGNPVSFTAEKGGWLPAQGTVLHFTTGGFGFVLAYNCNADVSYDWLTPISQLAAAQKWAANDLFVTTYNMKALGNSPQQQKLIVTQPERTLGETMSQVEASMTNGFLKSPSTK
jgi:hypothetical protein